MPRRCPTAHAVSGLRRPGWLGELPRILTAAIAALVCVSPNPDAAESPRLRSHWPNPWSAQDAVSGQHGLLLPVLPASFPPSKPMPFGSDTGWAQLQPTLPASPFTLTGWILPLAPSSGCLISQEDSQVRWRVERWTDGPADSYVVVTGTLDPAERTEAFILPPNTWHLLGLTRRADGSIEVRVNGRPVATGTTRHAWPRAARWFCVGNLEKGDQPWHGLVRDLQVHEGHLQEAEWSARVRAGVPPHQPPSGPALDSALERRDGAPPLPAVPQPSSLAPPSPEHRRYTTEDGLPSNNVQAVLRSRSGHLWVGTDVGLTRFDGRDFRTFDASNHPALAATGGDVVDLAEAEDGTLWAGTFGGLLRIRGTEITAFTDVLPERFVARVTPAGNGTVWIAGFRNDPDYRGPCRVRRFDPATGRTEGDTVIPGQVRRLVPEGQGLWVLAEEPHAVYRWPGPGSPIRAVATALATPPFLRVAATPAPGSSPQIRWGTRPDHPGHWVEFRPNPDGTPFHFLIGSGRFPVQVANASGSSQTTPQVWIGAPNGLCRISGEPAAPIALPSSLANLDVACLTTDPNGEAWMGTLQDGLHFLRERPIRVHGSAEGLPGLDVQTVAIHPDGTPWVGTDAGLAVLEDGLWSMKTALRPRSLAFIQGLNPIPVVGVKDMGRRGLLLHGNPPPPDLGPENGWSHPNAVLPTRDGGLWTACALGLTWIEPAAMHRALLDPEATPPPGPGWKRWSTGSDLGGFIPYGLVADRDGAIWTGSLGGGLFRATPESLEQIPIPTPSGGGQDPVVPLCLDRQGALWFAGPGLLGRRHAGRVERLTTDAGLPEDRISGMLEGEAGELWIAGRRGVHRLERTELEAHFAGHLPQVRSLSLGVSDGLPTPECASAAQPILTRAPDGRLWVATRAGLAVFHPNDVRPRDKAPPVAIETLRVRGHPFLGPDHSGPGTIDAPLILPPGSGASLEFHCSAVSLTAADRIRFRHRMDGHDADWSEPTDLRVAFYTNLRPGEYVFRTEAFHLHTPGNRQEAQLRIRIRAHPWETNAFRVATLLLTLLAMGLLHRRRLNHLRGLEELRRKEALANDRARIAADLHDDIGAALTQITMLGEMAKARSAPDSRALPTLDRALGIARDVTRRMGDLVWSTQDETGTLDTLLVHLREQLATSFHAAGIPCRLSFPTSPPSLQLSSTFRRNVLLAGKEAAQNILKHAHASTADIQLDITPGQLSLRITDNGRGFDPSNPTHTGRGLANMERRVTELGGQWQLQSAPGHGTTVRLQIPLPPD